MCGIVGTITRGAQVDRSLLAAQRDTLRHRGPDGEGLWVSSCGTVGFGHRRLAIIDLSSNGAQPMIDSETGNVVTFNGELYNFTTLRRELEGLGAQFRTQSDTEVLLLAYRYWGENCLRRLEGMFAFALFDAGRASVLLARDRAGEKPLYIFEGADRIHFASEIKAILRDPACSAVLDPIGFEEFLAFGFSSDNNTCLKGIRRLSPGTAMWITDDGRLGRHWTYWSALSSLGSRSDVAFSSIEQAVTALESVLKLAVGRQMVADVPLGILLSGGVDSSLITAIAAGIAKREGNVPRTFTVAFPGFAAEDESGFASQIATHFGTAHTVVPAQMPEASILSVLAAQFDDPIADSSMLPTYMVSCAIREHATVALGGDGGDELFGGYPHYSAMQRLARVRDRVPSMVLRSVGALASWLPGKVSGATVLSGFSGPQARSAALCARLLSRRERLALSPSIGTNPKGRSPEIRREMIATGVVNAVEQSILLDFTNFLPNDVLAKVDRASMLASLEVRAPLLDAAILEFSFERVPAWMKVDGDARKILLRQLAQRILPKDFDSRRKQGFSIPLRQWLCNEWRDFVFASLDQAPAWLIDRRYAERIVKQVEQSGRGDHALFGLVMASLWANHYSVGA